jgi:hypothetical protein
MNHRRLIEIATKHAGHMGSALICLHDAIELAADGDYENACERALKSICYSVGIFHEDYRLALSLMPAATH